MRRTGRGHRAALSVLLAAALAVALPGAVAGQSPPASPGPSGVPGESVAPSPVASGVPASPAPSASPFPPPVIKLVDAGKAPRAVRQYGYTPGAAATMILELTQDVRTVIGDGVETAFGIPSIRYALDLVVRSVDPDGVATITMTVGAIEVVEDPDAEDPLDPAMVAQLGETLQGIVGVVITARMAPDGATLGASADLGDLDPALALQMTGLIEQTSQLSMALPSAPIGQGARWIATTTLTANGITFRSRTTATLKAVKGDVLTLSIKGRQTGVPGPVALPGLPAGYTAELVEMDGESAGRMQLDLTTLVPRSTSSGTVRAKLSATDGASTQTTTTTVTSRLVVKPGE